MGKRRDLRNIPLSGDFVHLAEGWLGTPHGTPQIGIEEIAPDAPDAIGRALRPCPGSLILALLPYESGRPLLNLPHAGLEPILRLQLPLPTAAPMRPLLPGLSIPEGASIGSLHPRRPDGVHATGIEEVKKGLEAGEIYQANLSRVLELSPTTEDFGPTLFARLQTINPVDRGAYLRVGSTELVSNSMETLFHFDPATRRVASYPIKGTLPRSPGDAAPNFGDIAKEQAEHIMIVDLVRNDLGRVCTPGSIRAAASPSSHAFHGLWHAITEVSGELDQRFSAADAFKALFPGGSIVGCPKRRATALLETLEAEPRGYYTGSLVLVRPDGGITASILIRTALRTANRSGWELQVGGGIVYDSDPAQEVMETWQKAKVFAAALQPQQQRAVTETTWPLEAEPGPEPGTRATP